MRIEPTKIDGIFESQAVKNNSAEPRNSKEIQRDKVEFSKNATEQEWLKNISAKTVREISEGTDPVRLKELKEQISAGTYFVSADEIASAIITTAGSDE